MTCSKSPLWNLWNFKVSFRTKKTFNLVPKMSFWVNLGQNLKKLVILEVSTFQFLKCKVLRKTKKLWVWKQNCHISILLNYCHIWNQHFWILKRKKINLRPKLPDLVVFWLNFEKNFCHIWNQHPRICQSKKYPVKQFFWLWVFTGQNLKTLWSYWKSAPSNLSKFKVSR